MPGIKSVKDADVAGKRVLVRCDFDVPMESGKIMDDSRIKAALPTIQLLQEKGAQKIILIAHVGRPGGTVDESLRMAPVEARLRALTSVPFELRENLRFDPREEVNDPTFAQELASLGDIYVNEAFGNSHRKHSSMVGVPTLLPKYAGVRLMEEITRLSEALTPPPGAIALIGGVKVETKAPLIKKFAKLYEVLVGGAIANQYVSAEKNVLLPQDGVPELAGMLDIGPATAAAWAQKILNASFVVWNGPMGVYEQGYTNGTDVLAAALARATCKAVVGGGDTVAAIAKSGLDEKRVFVSTGGGAMLEFLIDGSLPGIEVLRE